MEEKERFELFGEHCIKDNNPDARCQLLDTYKACVILNEQDKRIKELKETNKVLSNELTKNSILKQDHIETCCGIPIFEIPKIKEENQQLKQLLCLSDSDKVYEKYFELKQQLEEKDADIIALDIDNYSFKQQIENLRQQLKSQPEEIVEKIKEQLIKRLNTIAGYGRMTTDELSFFIETEFSSDLDTILKEYQK